MKFWNKKKKLGKNHKSLRDKNNMNTKKLEPHWYWPFHKKTPDNGIMPTNFWGKLMLKLEFYTQSYCQYSIRAKNISKITFYAPIIGSYLRINVWDENRKEEDSVYRSGNSAQKTSDGSVWEVSGAPREESVQPEAGRLGSREEASSHEEDLKINKRHYGEFSF